MSYRHVSALKGPFSGSTIDIFQQQVQQNELPDAKFILVSILLTLLLKSLYRTP